MAKRPEKRFAMDYFSGGLYHAQIIKSSVAHSFRRPAYGVGSIMVD
jgi:hypothetical protein